MLPPVISAGGRSTPLACAVACASLDVLIEENMISNAASVGAYLKAGLEAVRTDAVREVRGRGLMLAIELREEAGLARDYVEVLARHGVLTKDAHDQTIRIAPPLIITRQQADWAIERFAAALEAPRAQGNGLPLYRQGGQGVEGPCGLELDDAQRPKHPQWRG